MTIHSIPISPALCVCTGVLLHEMLRLDLPFVGSSTADLVKAILSDEPPQIPSHYSTGIKYVDLIDPCVCVFQILYFMCAS
jgi:serine/threonine protein kinase